MSELALLCRTCARPAASLQPLFAHPERYKRYALALKLATGLQIEMNDGLPQQICTECSQEINRVLKFRTNSQKAQTELLALGFRKTNAHDHASYAASTTVNKELELVDDKNLDSDESLNEGDYYEDSLIKVRKLSDMQKKNFSENDKEMIKQIITTQFLKPVPLQHKYQSSIEKYLDTSAPLYTCKECKKKYKNKGSFGKHTDIHTGLECMCDRCGKAFWSMSMLVKHQRAIHGAARDVNMRCPYCEYHALDYEHLKVHIRNHTGERPFICDACAASFTSRELLVQHLTIHTTERKFPCKECSSKFRSRHELNIHFHRRHRPRRWNYQCFYCLKLFVKSYSCRQHMLKLHGVPMDKQEKNIRVPLNIEDKKE